MSDENNYFKSKLAIAKALGVHRHTIDLWEQKTWFPKRGKDGWLKSEVLDAVDEYELKKEGAIDTVAEGSKEQKTALECKRLKIIIEKEKELLEQAKAETRRINMETDARAKQLIEKKEVLAGLTATTAKARSVIESWAKTCTAEDPANHDRYKRAVETYLKIINAELPKII